MKHLTFKREKLYDEVWAKPMTELAKDYGINVYQLTKACDELEIPRPESGYWSKLRHGKKVKKKPLTDSDKNKYLLNFDTFQPLEMDQLLPKGYRPIVIKDQLRNPHPLVRQTYKYLKERSQGRSPGDEYGRLKPRKSGYLGVAVAKDSLKRAMRILDAILKESKRQGFKVGTVTQYKQPYTYIQIAEDKVYIYLQEEAKQIKTKIENLKNSWEKYKYERYTTGKLKLTLSASVSGFASRKISDTKTKTLEEQSDKFFPILLEISEKAKKRRIEHEEAERKAEIARKIREQRELEYQAEMKRREELEHLSERFTKSEYIYQFIREVESKIEIETFDQEQVDRFNHWKKWALEHADRLNPVNQTVKNF